MRKFSTLAKLSASSLVIALAAASPALAKKICDDEACRITVPDGVSETVAIETPKAAAVQQADTGDGYSISVDGEVVAGSKKLVDAQRKADVALENVDIQVKFDGLDVKPMLNVSTVPVRRAYKAAEDVNFLASLNYGAWVTKSEIRIFEKGTSLSSEPFEIVEVSDAGAATWRMPPEGPADYIYVLRVYDFEDRFDETEPLTLTRSDAELASHAAHEEAIAPGYSEDRTAFRNIPVHGGAVTVFGRNLLAEDVVHVLGDLVPVDAEGKFVVQRILPPGDHDISVGVKNAQSKGLEFHRDINIPSSEWFYVGLADVTVGKRFGEDGIETVKPGEFDDVYTKGRLAFYIKGKMKGRTILTAAADTGEDKLQNLFRGLDSKDPRQFLKRIDPDDYYPVYGDDSSQVEDAPTRGKFYLRLERGDSSVMWGNFKTSISSSRFLRKERALYGGNAVYKSETQAPDAGRTTELNAYVAQPGTVPARDELRGTGGSAYFLKHSDITIGSESVSVIVRDSVTGVVTERRELRFGVDYSFDYVQGVVLLRESLPSTSSANGVVRSFVLGGDPVFLAVSYEFTPAAGDVKGYVYGGSAHQWIGDHVRVGVTGLNEKTGAADQKMVAADVRLQKSNGVYIEGEVARSKGPGFGKSTSADGGLTIDGVATAGNANKQADAWRATAEADLAELSNGKMEGRVSADYQHIQGGFSSLDQEVTGSTDTLNAKAYVKLSDRLAVGGDYAEKRVSGGNKEQSGEVHADIALNEHVVLSPGVRHSMRKQPASTTPDNGARTDAGVKITYSGTDDHSVYLFGQTTINRTGSRKRNDRLGAGGEIKVTERVTVGGEASYGSSGVGALIDLAYSPAADDRYYIGYRLDPDRSGTLGSTQVLDGDDLGHIVGGLRRRISDSWTVYAEDSYDMFGSKRTLAQTYGVDYTPDSRWTLSGNMEWGRILDDSIDASTGLKRSDFDRKAAGLSASYKGETGNTGRVKGEIRLEDSDDGTRDMNSYLFAASIGLKQNESWRLFSNLDAVFADATDSTRDGRYVEGSIGYAYRPIENDRLNALFKYAYVYDRPGKDQVGVDGTTSSPEQMNHIATADVSYDVNDIITVGGKYGFRIGETRARNGVGGWFKSSAHLGVLRADVNIIKEWDALLEARLLYSPETDSMDIGALVALYRHFGDNFKMGVGYNFGRFSDDLRDLTLDDHGVFINAIGKF